ncbi:MAG: type IV pilus modification PilV family protein [Calditrichota bacterium]
MKSVKRLQAGISMLEVMITMFLVMMGLLVVMTSFVAIAKSNRYSERMDIATSLARLEMERIRNLDYANIQSETGYYYEYPEQPSFRHETTVATIGNTKEITLHIYFENDRRRAELKTYITNM